MNPYQNSSTQPVADDQDYRSEYIALWEVTVDTLTAAVRLKHPTHGEADFAEFLASALAAVAANVGSTERVTAGRPGSWEADLVEQLLTGTVGDRPEDLVFYRSEPVVIHLNVHRLIIESGWSDPTAAAAWAGHETPYDQEIDELIERGWALAEQEEYDPDAEGAEHAAITAWWARAYAAYAEAFTAVVHAEAARIPGLQVPVTVHAVTEPGADFEGPEHPDQYGQGVDPIGWRLWQAARSAVPLPGTQDTRGKGS
jgi:hypothetical protein